MVKKLSVFIILLFFIAACSEDAEMVGGEGGGDKPSFEVPTIIPDGTEKYLTLNSDYIFDQAELHTFHLVLSTQSLAKIDVNPAAEQYVEGMLIFESDTISPVGIRYKGSVGGFVGCVSGSDWTNPSGHKTCTKLSMKVKINWEGRNENFYGLKKLQFHSQNLDDSQMHERLGYWLFRQMGVPAPRSVHARLMINGRYSGLYALTEQVDGRFARYNFDDGKGNVYKEVWPISMVGIPHPEHVYKNALKTNEDDFPNVSIIRDFGQAISNADSEGVRDLIISMMDLEEIISFAVVDRMIRNDDGPFHWYCGGGGCSNHNYYWYEEPNNKKLHLIPWDLDNTFENIISNANAVTPIADAWGRISNSCQPFPYGAFNYKQRSAACDKLTQGWTTFTEEYAQLRQEFIDGPFSENSVNSLIETWSDQIRNATIEAQEIHGDAVSVNLWQNAMNKLKNQLTYARNQ